MRKRRRVIPSRWSSAQAQAEGSLNRHVENPEVVEQFSSNVSGRWLTSGSRTRPLYEADEAARER